jgi:hypothetical protein
LRPSASNVILFFRKNPAFLHKSRTQNSNAYQNEMTQSKSKEISAQKLCAGTVSGATHKAGGLYKRHQGDALRLAKLLIISGDCHVAAHRRHYTVFPLFMHS